MVREDLIICKTRALLDEFLAPMQAQVDKPRKRFLRQAVRGILLSGTLVLMELCRWIKDPCSDRFYQDKRLLNHLVSPRGDLKKAITAYHQSVARMIQPDTPLIIDLTDLAKPRAKKMKYLALVRDGSEDKLVKGYWCVEVYAGLKRKRVLPLALDVYSVEDPAVGSQNLQIQRVVQAIHQDLQGQGIWVADRGFDGLEAYETWFSLPAHFVIRQRGDRAIITSQGVRLILEDYVEWLHQHHPLRVGSREIVFARVSLPERAEPLHLVASWRPGEEKPLMVLTTLMVTNLDQARQVLGYYRQRWVCEEAVQFLKMRVGFERFRVRRYEALQRLAILAMFAMGFLTWILLRSRDLTGRLFSWTSRFRRQARFVYYRLLDGLQEVARLNPNALIEPPPNKKQNG
jgi:Transposase DDE domain